MGKGALLAAAVCVSMLADTSWAQVFGGGRVPGTRFDGAPAAHACAVGCDPPADPGRDSGREPSNSRTFEPSNSRTFEPSKDLYRADPDTYAPGPSRHRDRREFRRGYGYGYGADLYVPAWPMVGYAPGRSSIVSAEVSRNGTALPAPSAILVPRDDRADTPLPVTRIAEPGPPKTFYVIPRCFAGDTPPRPEQLPEGCDLKDLRVVPPVN